MRFLQNLYTSRDYISSCLNELSFIIVNPGRLFINTQMFDLRGDSSSFNHPLAKLLRFAFYVPNARVYGDFMTYTILCGLVTRKVRLSPRLIEFNRLSYRYPYLFGFSDKKGLDNAR